MTWQHRVLFTVLILVTVSAAGCSDRPALGQIQGTVTLDDKPLPNGTLTFEMPGRRPATARIENGKIVEATTFSQGDGVPVGSHKVAVSATEAAKSAVVANPGDTKSPPPADYMSGKSLIPSRYNNPETSKLTAEIKKGDNTLEFKLTSK